MPVAVKYPGVYIEEIPSGVRTITGVATSVTAFVGRAKRGPVNEPRLIHSYADYERMYGGLWAESTLSYAVKHFYQNGGMDAVIVRLHNEATATIIELPAGANPLVLTARNPGTWGNKLRVTVDHNTRDAALPNPDVKLFNLTVVDDGTGNSERFLNVSVDPKSSRAVDKVVAAESSLLNVQGNLPDVRPVAGTQPLPNIALTSGGDGSELTDPQYLPANARDKKEGIFQLEKTGLFNLLCIPPISFDKDVAGATLSEALTYCVERRAMLIVDAPSNWKTSQLATAGMTTLALSGPAARNAAMYFPRLRMPDPVQEGRLAEFAPCGAVAGIMARTDTERGVWKAPAGQDAALVGVVDLSIPLTDGENGDLNPLGLNCLRAFPVIGRVVWGARTLRGADQLADEYKYVPVRRLALFLEESLYRGTQWVVFEPNDEPLWAQIRLNVGAFMHDLFRQGAFQGQTPRDAYFVKCDRETTTENDRNRGVVNIVVGFAPLKPAEFVIIKIQQIAGQVQA